MQLNSFAALGRWWQIGGDEMDQITMTYIDAYYFGCWDGPGHYLRDTHGRMMRESTIPTDFPCPPNCFDGCFLPPKLPELEGRASLVHLNGWTILAFWDRSVDKRGKCNSAFILRNYHDFDEAKRLAQVCFPQVWKRFTFEVGPYRPQHVKA
jgi:hypothetical protein